MGVVNAKIQTVEDIYRLVWSALAHRQPIRAIYKERPRLFGPHRLGCNRAGQRRVLCYQYGGASESGLEPVGSPANWRCIVLEKRRAGGTAGRLMKVLSTGPRLRPIKCAFSPTSVLNSTRQVAP